MALSEAPARPAGGGWNWVHLTRMEVRMGWRTAAFRVAAVVAFLFGYVNGEVPGVGSALSAYTTGEAGWRYLGLVAVIWMSLAAVRETSLRTDVLVYSKPQVGERVALSKFLGNYFQLILILAAMFVGALMSRVAVGGLVGAEVFLLQFARAAGVLFFAAAASFTLSLLFDSPIAGSLVALYWILTMAGKSFLAKFYFPSYTQNLPAYIAFGAGLLCVAFWLHRRKRRGSTPPEPWVRVGAPLFFLIGGWALWSVIRYGHDPQAIRHPAMDQITQMDADMGLRAPGFLLPDQYGRQRGLSDFAGKILLIALWSPHDPDSVLLLDRLNEVEARFGAQGVQPIAICLGEDTGAAVTFARGERLRYPVFEDWGTYNAPVKSEISPVANAYRTSLPPKVVVTDRRRMIKGILVGSACYDGDNLEDLVSERLEVEPK
jgi:hypothetical protein